MEVSPQPSGHPEPERTEQSPAQSVPPPPSAPAPRTAALAAISWMRDLFVSVMIAAVVILFLYQPVKVEGTSMMPMLVDQERIFINKFAYKFGFSDVARGDTVVFWFPGDTSKSYIKRVVGVPGDKIEVRDGTVIVNSQALAEPYVPDSYRDHVSLKETVVAPGEYFVLGDHRSSSNDSRMWGTVPRRYIYGKASFVYWPLDRLGLVR